MYFSSFSQWYDPEKINEKASTVYNMAVEYARGLKYSQAIRMLNDAIKLEPKYVDAYLSLAGVNAEIKNYNMSVVNFEKAFQLDSVYSRYYLLPYSISLAGEGRFKDALEAVTHFLSSSHLNNVSRKAGEFRKTTFQFAIDYVLQHTESTSSFNPLNLGDSINTSDHEYFPSLTIEGNKMIFTRRSNRNESFYESNLSANGKWSKARPLQGSITKDGYNEGAQNISQDGQTLVFTGCNFPGGLGSCDIYISSLGKQGWSAPENVGRAVNSEFWESSPSLSPDKQDLYFSSNVPGGFGGKDIWVSHRNATGSWGEAQNLGNEINTFGDETCPFIHADNETLYFNSTGLPGYSEKPDLFVSHKLPNGHWSKPLNLGYPINTIDDEGSLVVASNGKDAYYTSDRKDSKGGYDIYQFELRKELRASKTLWVRGKVFNSKTLSGVPSSIELTDLSTHQQVSHIKTDEEGNYLTTVAVGKNYAFNVLRKGYLFFSENFDLSRYSDTLPAVKNIALQPVEINSKIILKNVFYDNKSTSLKSASITELDDVVKFLNDNPTVKIEIAGYTDNIGKNSDNLKLSIGRAVSVVNYLIGKGVKPSRLTFKGLGDANPLSNNANEQGRALNRRTELKVVGL
ncbi:MAG: hypothetical protein NVSMB45_00060 [Ginsengibacter sp.]